MQMAQSSSPRNLLLQYLFVLAFMLCAIFYALPSWSMPSIAGQIEFVEGDVNVINVAGQSRMPHVNESLWVGDTISTGRDGELHVHMDDEGYLALRPNTSLKVDAYTTRATNDDNAILSLIKGTFRSITGWIGRNNPQKYRINVGPVATIGVRGTDHEPAYIPEHLPGEASIGTPGAYDKVNSGKTFIQQPSGTIELGPQQSGYASSDSKAAPRLLDKVPDFYRPTKNEGRIDRRGKELSTQIGKKHNARQQQTRQMERYKAQAEHHPQPHHNIQRQKRLNHPQKHPKLSD